MNNIFKRLNISLSAPVIFDGMTKEEIDDLSNFKSQGYKLNSITGIGSYGLQFINKYDYPVVTIEGKSNKYSVWYVENNDEKVKTFPESQYNDMWKFVSLTLPKVKNIKE